MLTMAMKSTRIGNKIREFARLPSSTAAKRCVLFSVAALPAVITSQHIAACDAALVRPPLVIVASTTATQKQEHKSLAKSIIDKAEEIVYYVRRFVRHLKRLLMYALLGTPVVAIGATAYALGGVDPAIEEYVWDFCLWAVQALGPTFIKLAQWASTRPDLYPPGLVSRLEMLQDQVKVHYSFKTVEKTLAEAFGPNWKDKLEIDHNPIGAGCVAQVFKGRLKDKERTPVAIKLIHPHVEKMIKSDMELLTILTRWMDSFPNLEVLSLGETCRQWCDNMNKQLDLRVEASNLIKFTKKFKEDTWAVFPKPIEGLVTKHVLVETLVPGTPIVHYMKLGDEDPRNKQLKMKLSDLGARAVVKMVFFDNLIHGDMHPGNMIVQFSLQGEPRLVFLDAGIVYSAKSEKEHQQLVEICLAFLKHDGRRAGHLMIEKAGRDSRDSSKGAVADAHHQALSAAREVQNEKAFCEAVQTMIDDSETQSYFEHLGEYVARICDLARSHSVKLHPGYFHIAMALKVMEGVSLSLNKELELVSKCVPLIAKAEALRAMGIYKFPVPDANDDFYKTN